MPNNDGLTYDPEEIQVVWGPFLFTMFAPNTHVKAERLGPTWKIKAGSKGVTRIKNPSKAGSVTVVLEKKSPTNADLSAQLTLDEETNSVIYPLTVKDNRGNDLHTAAKAWIRGWPVGEENHEGPEREWILDCAELNMYFGG